MYYHTRRSRNGLSMFSTAMTAHSDAGNDEVSCDWTELRGQLMRQWDRLSEAELENTGHNRRNIARLIQRKYGISIEMAMNYLRNFERTLPLLAA